MLKYLLILILLIPSVNALTFNNDEDHIYINGKYNEQINIYYGEEEKLAGSIHLGLECGNCKNDICEGECKYPLDVLDAKLDKNYYFHIYDYIEEESKIFQFKEVEAVEKKAVVPSEPETSEFDRLKSDFFKDDPIAQSIVYGGNYEVTRKSAYTDDGRIDVLSFDFKLVNAFKQLGYTQLFSDDNINSFALVPLHKFQRRHGLEESNLVDRNTILLIDNELKQRELKDKEIAEKYIPFPKFIDGPTNEPSKEHLAMIYYNLFNVFPATIKARLWIQIRPNDDYPTVLNLEQFSAFINRYGNLYFGTLFDSQMNTPLSSQQVEEMISQNNYHFIFCGERYYSRRSIGSCSIKDSNLYIASIVSDTVLASILAHEFGHGVGDHTMMIHGINKQTHEHFGEISFTYNQNNEIILIRPENNDGEFVTEYAKTNYGEDFAESFSAYLHLAKIFRERAKSNIYLKMKYDFLKDNVFGGKEYDTGSLSSYNLWQSKNRRLLYSSIYQYEYMQEDPNWVWDYEYPNKEKEEEIPIEDIDASISIATIKDVYDIGEHIELTGLADGSIPKSNKKDSSKYSDKEVFLISDKDWRDVLPLVPLTTWTGDEDWCQRGYGTPENVCVYPTLVYHEEDTGFDVDSIIYFMQQYNTEKVTIIGESPQELDNLLIIQPELGAGLNEGNIKRISINDYLSYWQEYKDVVYVEDDYELALLASTYASLRDAPLIIVGTELDRNSNFYNRNVICIGNVNRNCNENYNLESLQRKYIGETNTDKIILINPNDLNIKVEENFESEKSTNLVYELYSKTSLAAPILASAKHEVILSIKSTDYQEVDSFIENKANGLHINYLTIVSSPNAIPLARNEFDVYRDWWQEMWGSEPTGWTQVDNSLYGDLDNDYYQDIAVGRIFSLTSSDVSSYIARSLFYEQIPKSNKFASLTSFWDMYVEGYANNLIIDNIYSNLGLKKESQYKQYPELFDSLLFKDKILLTFEGHSDTSGGVGGFTTSAFRNDNIWLSPSIIVQRGCLSCSYNKASPKSTLFCVEMIRRGAMAYVGATDVLFEQTSVGMNFLRELTKNEDVGTAFKDGSNIHFADRDTKYSPFQTLLGDPTFNPGFNLNQDIDTVSLVQSDLIKNNENKWIKNINIKLKESSSISLKGIRNSFSTNLDFTTPPTYFGENVFRSNVYYFNKYKRPGATDGFDLEDSEGKLLIFLNFQNPQNLALKKISHAEMRIGKDTFNITDQLIYDKERPFAKSVFSFNNKGLTWVWLEFNLNQGGQKLVEQNAQNIPAVEINIDFEFEEIQ